MFFFTGLDVIFCDRIPLSSSSILYDSIKNIGEIRIFYTLKMLGLLNLEVGPFRRYFNETDHKYQTLKNSKTWVEVKE